MKVNDKVLWIGLPGIKSDPSDPDPDKVYTVSKVNSGGVSILVHEHPVPPHIISMGGIGWLTECWEKVEPKTFTNEFTKALADDFIEKDGQPEIERIKIFTTKAEF